MAISIDWDTYVINVPQDFLTQTGPTTFTLDTNEFRIALRDIEDNEAGVVHPKTHNHNTKVTLSGIEYARIIEILSPYSVTFEEFVGSPYRVFLTGSNNNILDVANLNNVSIAPSNSAGLVQMAEIEFNEYANGIHLKPSSGNAGTLHPTGTQRKPVDNITDAVTICNARGVKIINLDESLEGATALTEAVDLTGFVIQGINHVNTILEIGTDPIVTNLRITGVLLQNTTLDGDVEIHSCTVGDINYLNGHIHDCGLFGTILLGGNNDSVIESCYTIDQDDPVVFDMNGTGNSLSLPNYSGLAYIENLSDSDQEIGIGLNAGMVVIDSTVTAGTIIIAGNGLDVNNGTPDAYDNSGLINIHAVQHAVWDFSGI